MGPSAGQDGFNPELPAVHFLLTLCLRHSTCCFMVLHTESPGSPSPLAPHHTTPTPTHPQPLHMYLHALYLLFDRVRLRQVLQVHLVDQVGEV